MHGGRTAAAGALLLAVTATLAAGCGGHHDKAAPHQCADYTGRVGARFAPRSSGSDPVDGLGAAAAIPTREGAGTMTAAVTGIDDPVAGGRPDKGCRWVGISLRLRDPGQQPASIDLYHFAFLVSDTNAVYGQTGQGPSGRDGVDGADLVAGDERRGSLIFQIPAHARIRYFVVSQDKVDGPRGLHNAALVLDLRTALEMRRPVLEPYQPGAWPALGATQQLYRLPGEQLEVTPLRVLDPAPGGKVVRAGYRPCAVQLRAHVTGAKEWPANPDAMSTLIDDSGRQWFPAGTNSPAAPIFDAFDTKPGGVTTAWVNFEIAPDAHPVALMVSAYPGRTWAWRL